MKIHINTRSLIALLVLINFLFFIALIYIFILIRGSELSNIGETSLSYFPFTNKNVEDIKINSKSFVIFEPESRVVVAAKNENLRFSPASTAKIMTAIISFESYPIAQVFTAKGVTEVRGSSMGLEEEEKITVENLLFGLMLPSGNDAAFVLAENYPGGERGFIEAMNRKLEDLKLSNTKFVDPSGYSDDNYTTALDLVRLASYALKNKKLAQIVSTRQKTVFDLTGKKRHELSNLNQLLGKNGVNGIKTGFTDEAGGVLVSSLVFEGKTYIVVVLHSQDRFGDTENIIKEAIKNLNLIAY